MYSLLPSTASAELLACYARLLADVFQKPDLFTEKYLRWQYADNPHGHLIGFDAWTQEGELAAHYATIPVVYKFGSAILKGLLSLNTATANGHQGRGLFTRLATDTYQKAADDGYQFVLGVANAQSTPGFLRNLGFSLIAPLEAKIGLGSINWQNESIAFCSQNSAEYLRWRLARPKGEYFIHGDNLYAPTAVPGISAQLLHTASQLELESSHQKRIPIARLWIGHSIHKKKSGIWASIPNSIRPSPLNLIYLDLTGKPVPQAEEIYFEALDFDAY